jgi:hypothetical protein
VWVKGLIRMASVARWILVAVLAAHGMLHLLGVAKGFGWADVPQLTRPTEARAGFVWLLATLLVLAAAALIAVGAPTWWWAVALTGAAVSQAAIISSWNDAKVGTVVNVVLAVVAAYGFLSVGPSSYHARWDEQAARALSGAATPPLVLSEGDLDHLPESLAAYIRRSGAVGEPQVLSLYADFHGRIRSAPDEAWMSFTGTQVNTFGADPERFFIMDATRSGLPVTVLHAYSDATATMQAKVLSLVTVVDAAGAEMDRGETVTVFNDLVVLAPGAIAGAPIRWVAIDDRHVRGFYTNGSQTVSAVLTFDSSGDLVDFVSEDRLRASADGTSFVGQPWSTPLLGHRDADGHRVLTNGEGRWRDDDTWFTYVELTFDGIRYNPSNTNAVAQPLPVPTE